jgi:hypothetical protein
MRLILLALLCAGCLEPGPTPSPTPTSHYHIIKSSQQ